MTTTHKQETRFLAVRPKDGGWMVLDSSKSQPDIEVLKQQDAMNYAATRAKELGVEVVLDREDGKPLDLPAGIGPDEVEKRG